MALCRSYLEVRKLGVQRAPLSGTLQLGSAIASIMQDRVCLSVDYYSGAAASFSVIETEKGCS
jgi:hypothetical protein